MTALQIIFRCEENFKYLFYFHAFSATCIILANSLAMLVIYKNKKLHNVPGIFRFNLAVADCSSSVIFIGGTFVPGYLVFSPHKFENINSLQLSIAADLSHNDTVDFSYVFPSTFISAPLGETFINSFGCFCYITGFATIYSYVLVSFDRYFAIKYPMKYKINATNTTAYKACFLVWIFAVLFSLLLRFIENLRFWFFQSLFVFYTGEFEIFFDVVLHLFPLCLCWIVNVLTLISIKNSENRIRKLSSEGRVDKRVARAAKTIFILVLVYTMSVLPFNVSQLVHLSKNYRQVEGVELWEEKSGNKESYQYVVCVIFLYNSFWNFFIYQFRDPVFKRYMKSVFSSK